MQRARMLLVAVVCALAAMIVAPAALGATPQQVYGDYARDGRLDQRYSTADLQRAVTGFELALIAGAVLLVSGATRVRLERARK